MADYDPNNLGLSFVESLKSVSGTDLTLDELLNRAPPVGVAIRLPAIYVLAIDTFAEQAGLSRNKLVERLVTSGMAELVQSHVIPAGPGEMLPAIDLKARSSARPKPKKRAS